MTPLQRITERVTRRGHPDERETPVPLVTLEEFFSGNDVVGSIGCNLESSPGPAEIGEVLAKIAARPDVADIRVKITAFDMPEWPFSDTVYVMTSAPLDEIEAYFPEHLRPDEFWEGYIVDEVYEPYDVPPGTRPVACWWD